MNYKTAILLTCFNRKDTTLECLQNLFKQETTFDVYLVDDGSTDGTYTAVEQYFPQVNLIKSKGDLFWNRGMRLAWQTALRSKTDYDYFIWLNDDTQIYENSLSQLISYSVQKQDKAIICAAIEDASTGSFTYGGKDKMYNPHIPNKTLQKIHYMNGNFVLVPQYVVQQIGILDQSFRHHLGDYDYGLRAAASNIKVLTTPVYLGSCEKNQILGIRGRKPNTNLRGRFRFLYSPLGVDPVAQFIYNKRHFGKIPAFKEFILVNLNNMISDKIYKFYQGSIKPYTLK